MAAAKQYLQYLGHTYRRADADIPIIYVHVTCGRSYNFIQSEESSLLPRKQWEHLCEELEVAIAQEFKAECYDSGTNNYEVAWSEHPQESEKFNGIIDQWYLDYRVCGDSYTVAQVTESLQRLVNSHPFAVLMCEVHITLDHESYQGDLPTVLLQVPGGEAVETFRNRQVEAHIQYRGHTYRRADTVSEDPFDEGVAWTFTVDSWDILEGKTLYSHEGPEIAEPTGLEVVGTLRKTLGEVPVEVVVKYEYGSLDFGEDRHNFTMEGTDRQILSVTPSDLQVVIEEEIVPFATLVPDILSTVGATEQDHILTDDMANELRRRWARYQRAYSRLQNRWHTQY